MIINNAINSPLPTSLALGGMNAALTASNGGIFYSTASAGAILSGTATSNQTILSGSSSAPSWSTNTYPSTTTANELLYSSSTNVIGGLATANSACMVSDAEILPITYYPVWSLPMNDGQIIIGGTNGRPEPFNLTAGQNVSIINSPGSVTINSLSRANWKWIATRTASSSTSLDFNNQFSSSYVAYRLVLVNILPAVSATQLHLRFGIGSGTYISTNTYIFQLCDINSFAIEQGNFYYAQNSASQVLLTYANAYGVTINPIYGGVSGTVDLFVNPGTSQVANGISCTAYASYDSFYDDTSYINSRCTFQLPANNYTSVQLYVQAGTNMASGSASLYGLTVG